MCLFFPVSKRSATQTPLSHSVRSSDWVETKCFRSKVAQRQTHSWPRLKSKLWGFSSHHQTKGLNVDADVLCLCWLSGRRPWSSCYPTFLTRKRTSLPSSVLSRSSSHCLRPGDQRMFRGLGHFYHLLSPFDAAQHAGLHCLRKTCYVQLAINV